MGNCSLNPYFNDRDKNKGKIMIDKKDTKSKEISAKQKKLIQKSNDILNEISPEKAFASPVCALALFPTSRPKDKIIYQKTIKNTQIEIINGDGVPYGAMARQIFLLIITEAVKKKTKRISLGRSIPEFLEKLGLSVGGAQVNECYNQTLKIVGSSIKVKKFDANNKEHIQIINFSPIKGVDINWAKKNYRQKALEDSFVILSDDFYNEINSKSFPINFEIVKALNGSSLDIDLYVWLTYRNSFYTVEKFYTWTELKALFGENYKEMYDFKRKIIPSLERVKLFYPQVSYSTDKEGITFYPSVPSIPKTKDKFGRKLKDVEIIEQQIAKNTTPPVEKAPQHVGNAYLSEIKKNLS